MKRSAVIALALFSIVGTTIGSTSATAAPPNRTSVTLTCDKNVDATVSLTLESVSGANDLAAVSKLQCGPNSLFGLTRNRVEVPGSVAATNVNVQQFTGTFTGNCTGEYAIPAKQSCPTDGSPGATLVVR